MILDPKEKKKRLSLRLKGIDERRILIGPALVRLHLTDVCNVACKFCFEHMPGTSYRPSIKNNLPFDIFEGIVKDCKDLHVDAIHLSGLGEPTMHPNFYDMLQQLEPFFEVTIFSNGTFPIERCRDILRADRIIFNLGASDSEGYRQLYGRNFFLKVIKNIREIARLKPEINPTFSIEVVIVVTDENETTQLKTENFVKKFGVNRVHRKNAQKKEGLAINLKESLSAPWLSCYHGWFNSAINIGGHVNICSFLGEHSVGNVFTNSFKDIWNSAAYADARQYALTGDKFKNYKECINCLAIDTNKKYASQVEMYQHIMKK